MKPYAVWYQGQPRQRGDDYAANLIRVQVNGRPMVVKALDEGAAIAALKRPGFAPVVMEVNPS